MSGHEHGTEVLVLEGYPIHLSRHALLLGFGLGKFLGVVAVDFVGERGVHILEVKAFFVLGHTVFPFQLHGFGGSGNVFGQSVGLHREVEEVIVGQQRILHIKCAAIGCGEAQGQRAVGLGNGGKVVIGQRESAFLGVEGEVEGGILAGVKKQ